MQRVTLIDNYDSFTFNLVHYLGELGADVAVWRNDEISVEETLADEAGRDRAVARPLHAQRGRHLPRPRARGERHDADPRRLPRPSGDRPGFRRRGRARAAPMHGKVSRIAHNARGLFRGVNGPFQATRYHSLVIDRDTAPDELEVTAETDDGLIMGVAHRDRPVHGVQFHPESIASEHGHEILRNFLDLAAAFKRARPDAPERSGARMESFKPLIAKVAAGASLSRAEAAAAFDAMLSGEVTPAQMGGFLMALRVRGESVEEITGAVAAMRAKMLRGEGAGRRDRHRRHRRRRLRLLQCLDARLDHRRRLRRARRQARQSRRLLEIRRRRHARRARRQDRASARGRRALHRARPASAS